MLRKKEKRKSLAKYTALVSITITTLCLLLIISNNNGLRILGLLNPGGYVLGLQSSLEKQEQWIKNRKIDEANKLLDATPNPIVKIQMEGKLGSDPNKIQTIASLEDVQKIFTLSYAYKITKDPRYLNKSKELILAWAKTNKASGDSIDESHLQPLFEGYAWIKSSLSSTDIATIDNWLKTIANKEIVIKYNDNRDVNNWNSHRINIVGQIGFLVNDKKYSDYAIVAFKKQVQDNLLPDGSTFDFVERDALHYHCYDIWPLLNFAKTSSLHGINLYTYQSKSGATLEKSVRFLYPYVSGQKSHLEFVNSTAEWDKTTGSKTNPTKWDPQDGLYILELAYFFDDTTLPYVQLLRKNKAEYPSFEILLAHTQRAEIPTSK